MQAWGFANILFEPGEEFWQLVGQNAIWHIHDYSAQNIANGEHIHLCTAISPSTAYCCAADISQQEHVQGHGIS